MTASTFNRPKSQWSALLDNRSWEQLCEIDFPHALASGSVSRLRIVIEHLVSNHRHNLLDGAQQLADCINSSVLSSSNWNPYKIDRFLAVLDAADQENFEAGQKHTLVCVISAVVQSIPAIELAIDVFSPNDLTRLKLYDLAITQDNDLLSHLLNRTPKEQHPYVIEWLVKSIEKNIDFNFFTGKPNQLLFSATTAHVLPELANHIVKYICDDMLWEFNLGLNLKRHLAQKFHNLMSPSFFRTQKCSNEEQLLRQQKKIAAFEEFVDMHSNALTSQHWDQILTLFTKIKKKHNVSGAPILQSYALHGRLNKAVDGQAQIGPSSAVSSKRIM